MAVYPFVNAEVREFNENGCHCMQLINGDLLLSASDLSKHLSCRHANSLDLKVARGEIKHIYRNDPSIEVLEERGRRHEAAYLAYLKDRGHKVLVEGSGLKRTLDAMKSGVEVIAQRTPHV